MARRPPSEPLILFLDENLDGDAIADVLNKAGIPIKRLSVEFQTGIEDVDWIPTVARNHWAIITRDARIRRRAVERDAVFESAAILVALRGRDLSGEAMAAMIVAAYPRIAHNVETRRAPMILYVSRDGDVELKDGGQRRGGPKPPSK